MADNRQNRDPDDMDIDLDDDDDEMYHLADEDLGLEPVGPVGGLRPIGGALGPVGGALGPLAFGPVAQLGPGLPPELARHLNSFHQNLFSERTRRFSQDYRVVSVQHLENRGHQNLESGGKVILPPSALQQLSRNSSALLTPMMFKATNPGNNKFTHCGVLEFITEEDLCYMPSWMMENLGLIDYDRINIEKVELATATFAKFQPQAVDFLEISNPKAILENSLRFFSCLTKGDIVAIHYNNRVYKLCVLEILPSNAVSIIECDMNVDFAAPIGYVSPSASRDDVDEPVAGTSGGNGFVPFEGGGNRLNGKTVPGSTPSTKKVPRPAKGAPDEDWKIGSLQFKRKFAKSGGNGKNGEGEQKQFQAFGGAGVPLKPNKRDDTDDSFEL